MGSVNHRRARPIVGHPYFITGYALIQIVVFHGVFPTTPPIKNFINSQG